MKKYFASIIIILSFYSYVSADESKNAMKYIEGLSNTAFDFLKQENSTLENRAKSLKTLVENQVDLEYVGKYLLGKYQRRATPEQIDEFSHLFIDYMVLSYSNQLKQFAGVDFKILKATETNNGAYLVNSKITQSNKDSFDIQWMVKKNASRQWQIIDILVNGLSMIATQRDEFVSVIRRQKGNIGKFIKLLSKQVEKASKKLQ